MSLTNSDSETKEMDRFLNESDPGLPGKKTPILRRLSSEDFSDHVS